MTLSQRCESEFDSRIRSRGRSYANSDRVRIEFSDVDFVEAIVRGSGADYEVRLEVDADDEHVVRAYCDCPYFESTGLCKHIWATILRVDGDDKSLKIPGGGKVFVVEEDDDDDEPWSDESLEEFEDALRLMGTTTKAPHWEAVFHDLAAAAEHIRSIADMSDRKPEADAEAWFIIDIPKSTRAGLIVINLQQRQRRKNGEWGKIKKLSLDLEELNRFADDADRDALQQLFLAREEQWYDDGYYHYAFEPKPSAVALRADAARETLQRITGHPRFFATLSGSAPEGTNEAPLTSDLDPPYRFRVRFDRDESAKQYLVRGEFFRDHKDVVLVEQAMLASQTGILLLPGRVCTHEARDAIDWISVLSRETVIRIPFADGPQAVAKLFSQTSGPEVLLPEELAWERVEGLPEPKLRIVESDPSSRYWANRDESEVFVEFVYGEESIAAKSTQRAVIDAENRRAIVRNRQRERELLDDLDALPFHNRQYGRFQSSNPDYYVLNRNLPTVVEHLAERNWRVEADGKPVRSAGDIDISVTTGIDWFDLEANIDFGGVTAQLPELLKALREGNSTVTLSDGSQGLLNAAWLDKYRNLADLGESEDGKLRFRKSQALLLDALLAAQPKVSVDRKFAAYRRKLQSFDGIEPQNEPRGFQGELRGYQRNGLGWMQFLTEFQFGGCLADDMGLGKTVQVLALLQTRRLRRGTKDEPKRPSIAVVPKSLIFNWIDEAARFAPTLRIVNYTGGDRKATLEAANDYDLIITTYGTLRRDIAELKDVAFDYAILDEAQAIKNAKSQSAKACRLLNATHRLAMSGTPIENHLGELWSLFEFLNPGMLGRSKAFARLTKQTANHPEALAALRKSIAPFVLRRTKEQVLSDLPDKVEQTLYCELTGKQRKQYDELRQHYRDNLTKRIRDQGLKQSKIHVLEALLRLRQAACHPGLVDPNQKSGGSAKIDLLLDQLAEVTDEGHKALVFSQFTSLLAICKEKLEANGVAFEYLDGKTRNRKACVERFQKDEDCRLFLISLKAGGHGLNLTAADYVFILDPWWNPATEAQAVDRAHRIGQERNVFAYRLIARDTVEEKILELQKKKRELAEAVIAANESLIQKLTAEDLQLLLS